MIYKVKNQYSFFDKVHLAFTVLKTKFISKKARIIRKGTIIRGLSLIDLGEKLTTGYYCRLEALYTGNDNVKKIKFGNNVQLNDFVHIAALKSVELGDNVLVASHVYISDNSHGCYKGLKNDTSPNIPPISRPYFVAPVKIGSNVWIGEGVMIMPGVWIGNGTIIGAHAIVTKSIPENCIAVGSPAKIIKRYNTSTKSWEKI